MRETIADTFRSTVSIERWKLLFWWWGIWYQALEVTSCMLQQAWFSFWIHGMELNAKFSSDLNFCKWCGSSAHYCNKEHFNHLILQQKEEKEKRCINTSIFFSWDMSCKKLMAYRWQLSQLWEDWVDDIASKY